MRNVDDIYPLSPLQEGILFHILLAPGSGAYTVHLKFAIDGDFNPEAFKHAWQKVVDRHPVLRSSFVWEKVPKPLQIVRQQATIAWDERDWREFPEERQAAILQEYLREEHRRGFDPLHPPLMRMGLMRLGENRFQFIWNYSHLLLDGWSANLVLGDLSECYRAYSDGREVNLPSPNPYRSFIAWLQQQNKSEAEAFWRKRLNGFSAPTHLGIEDLKLTPGDNRTPEYPEISGTLDVKTTAELQATGRRHRLTLSTFFEAAWAWLMGFYGAATDVVFGVTVSGRSALLPGIESIVGVLANTIPLRVNMDGGQCLVDWFRDIQNQQVERSSREYASLVDIKSWSEVPGAHPLFESFLVFENHPIAAEAQEFHANVRFAADRAFGGATYPLGLRVEPQKEILLRVIYDQRRFSPGVITTLLSRLQTILTAMAAHPQQKIGELSLLSGEERQQVVREWNRTARPYPATALQTLLEQQAERTPSAIAVEDHAGELTYAELNKEANRLAHYLRELKVGPEVKVGICTQPSSRMITAVLSVLKAGGAYIPLSPDDPATRLRHSMHDSSMAVLLTERSLSHVLPEVQGKVIYLDDGRDRLAEMDDANPLLFTEPENAAYVIYTSGSTGAPKGVVVQYGSLLNYLLWVRETLLNESADCLPAITSLSFDASLKQILGPLLVGGTVSVRANFAADPAKSLSYIASRRGRVALNCVPSIWQKILEELECNPRVVPQNLTQLWLGGEGFTPELLERSQRVLPNLKISNLYGPTEATANAVYAEEISPQRLSIGRPIANARVYVLDLNLQPVPAGATGELFIGGAGVARGYQNHPELTAEKFIPSPFAEVHGERLYRTGDRARWSADGNLEFMGRKDSQVKLRGNRIELNEIEAALRSYPKVEQAAVLACEDISRGKYLAAYVAPKGPARVTAAELRSHLQECLPKYMVPGAFVLLESFPLTSSGKLDRQSLPVPNGGNGTGRPPRTPEEEALCEILADVLGLEHVSPEDNFFDLGGHSLAAMRLVGRIRAVLDMDLRLPEVFSASTVAELAERFTHSTEYRIPKPETRPARLPLSYSQQRLWFIDQLEGSSTQYDLTAGLRLRGILDKSALTRAVNTIVERHEILRTCFRLDRDGEPEQIILPTLRIDVPVENLAELDEEAQKKRIAELLRRERENKFDLAQGPLLRLSLIRLARDEHILVRSIHHIVYDGWSAGVFNREFAILYEAFREGQKESPLQHVTIQYADFALWQRSGFHAEMLAQQLAFWKENLAGIPQELELPLDRPRVLRRTFAGELCRLTISSQQLIALKRLARTGNATLYMVLMAAFAVLLKRYSGRHDVVIGSPIANRQQRQIEDSIGFFVNSLVMRVRVEEDAAFLNLLAAVRAMVLEAYRHQDLPFEQLVEELAPQRTLNVPPIFQVVFALQNTPEHPLQLPGLEISAVNMDELRVRHDLEVHAREQAGCLEIFWLYNRDLFDRWRMEQMAHHYVHLLEAIAKAPETPLYRLEMMQAEERQRLFELLDATGGDLPEVTVPMRFQQQAAARPDAEAIICGEERFSYRELNARANYLAAALKSSGVGCETLVGVALERSPEMIVALLAILKAGGAYVPIAPEYPALRRKEMIANGNLRHLITLEASQSEYKDLVVHVIPIDLTGSGSHDFADPALPRPLSMAAYVNYTSGSTGQPKGVLVSHASIIRLVCEPDYVTLDHSSRLLQLAPLSFDAATFEIWGALLNGGCLVIMPAGPAGAHEIGATLVRHRVNTLWLTAGLFREVVDSNPGALAGIRQLLAGGDIVSPEHVRRLLLAHPHCRFINGYGPTENTTFSCCFPVEKDSQPEFEIPIGFPIRHARAYVLDEKLQPVPVGVAGELYLSGLGLARGYLHQPALTAERFVADPYSNLPGTRMYRTGDLARCGHRGALEFLGRADRQVKVRGFRVEPREIEAALEQMEGVSQCAVAAWPEGSPEGKQDKRLVAYVVPIPGAAPSPATLNQNLKERLPSYMAPSDFVVLSALPLTANGKLDREALPRPERPVPASGYRPPRTPLEEMLCEMFAEVLQVERVGIGDNFFEIGGHSLLATRLVSRIRTVLGVELPMRKIFEFPSAEDLSAQLPQSSTTRIPLAPQVRSERVPLSYAQQRLWFIHQFEKTSVQYHIPAALRLRGWLDHAALRDAINAVVQRHESLRTRFIEIEGQAAQEILPEVRIDVPLNDLSGQDDHARRQRVATAVRQEREQPFDLSRGPLLRAKLLKLADEEHVLLLTFHHIIADGWSLGVFNDEFIAFYEAFRAGLRDGRDLPGPLPVQYPDFALWQRAWLDQKEISRELDYWKTQLAGIPEQLVLPQDRPRQARQTFTAGVCRSVVPAEVLAELKRLAHSGNATLYMALLAALAVLLERYTGQKDIVVGSPIANRQDPQLEKMIGFFVNSLVMRVAVDQAKTFPDLLKEARSTALSAYQHQDLPFEKLVEELAPKRSLNTPPIFQVMFALQNTPASSRQLTTLRVEPMAANELRVRLDLEIHAREAEGQLEFHWVYNSDLFDEWRIEQMARHCGQLIESVLNVNMEQPLWGTSILSSEERRQILVDWNNTRMDVQPQTLHELFERQAEETPNAIAVICGDQSISYTSLNRRSNRLARYLRKLGAGPEVMVGICMPRGLDLIIGILGILKSGSAYVPLDPNYPAERVEYMLTDSAAPLLVIQKSLAERIPNYNGQLVESWEEICAENEENPRRSTVPENPAYVIYTSGSTGTPKGVVIRHGSAGMLLHWARQTFKAEDLACVTAATSICFDLSVFEIFAPLSCGGSVLVVENALHIGKNTDMAQITLINTVPSAMRELTRSNAVPASVRTINLAGEALTAELVHQIFENTRAEKVFNLYGPSEDTTYSTWALLLRDSIQSAIPIGRPVANTQAYVLNEWLEPVPIGVAGELYLGGEGLSRGYLNRSHLTAASFIPDPFSTRAGKRMYRTGDLVRYLRNGDLEFLGRADQQVKLRGFRIELGEIETALSRYPGVGGAAAIVREDKPGEKRLVAYMVPAPEQQIDVEGLRRHLQHTLPDFMIPASMVLLESFPYTPNGKLDKKALPAPDFQLEKRQHEPPRSELEKIIARAWREVLEIDNVGVHDNFFDIGGHSILAKLVQAKLYAALGQEVDLVALFQFPTIAALAGFLDGKFPSQEKVAGETLRAAQQRTAIEKLRKARGV
jgi:amino acid adenylation domain-containing protein